MYYVDREKCTGCEICLDSCPVEAISMIDGKATIDENRCTDCGACVQICPLGAIYSEASSQQPLPPDQGRRFPASGFGIGRGMGRGMGRGLGRGPRDGRGRGRGGGGRGRR